MRHRNPYKRDRPAKAVTQAERILESTISIDSEKSDMTPYSALSPLHLVRADRFGHKKNDN